MHSTATETDGYLHSDGDADDDDGHYLHRETSDVLLPKTGSPASAKVRRAVVNLIKNYYEAAASGAGTTACALLQPDIASQLGAADASASTHRGLAACAVAIRAFFEQQHEQLVADQVDTMVVTDVRIEGNRGLAAVGFRKEPVGIVEVARHRGIWRVSSLMDTTSS